jgi:hypothetical protein
MLEYLIWAAIPIFIGLGCFVMGITPPAYFIARFFFLLAALILLGRLGWYLAFEYPGNKAQAIILAVIVFGIIGFVWVLSMKWVTEREHLEGKQEKSIDKPNFTFVLTPQIINAPPELKEQAESESDYAIKFIIRNGGKHVANNLYSRCILIDQQFQMQPTIIDKSEGNDFVPDGIYTCNVIFNCRPAITPLYVIFAIKYQDKELLSSKLLKQIYYFKSFVNKRGILPLLLIDVSKSEREDIDRHLKQELKDYLH